MTWHTDPARHAGQIVEQLHANQVTLPPDVDAAWKRLQAIEDLPEITPNAAAEAILAGRPDKEIQALLTAESLYDRHRTQIAQARHLGGQRVLNAIRRSAEDLHEDLRPTFNHVSGLVRQVAEHGNQTIEVLIKRGDTDAARLRTELPELEHQLRELRNLWAGIWQQGRTVNAAGIDCTEWRNPLPMTSDDILTNDAKPEGRWYNALIVKRGELWWPTPEQAIAAADEHTEALARGEQQRRTEFVNLNRAIDMGLV